MTVLAKNQILKEIKKGRIKINPFSKDQVEAGSVDLHLADEFRVFNNNSKIIDVKENLDVRDYSKIVRVKDSFIIKPGQLIQGITKEHITLANNICGWLQGRSRFARMGLSVHVSANFVQPGSDNRQVLEIINLSNIKLALHPGTRFCQIVFERCDGKAEYKGRYSSQESV
ncbi:MAG: dCTP deaminase, dUMP-forming [Candidatus Woesearchaeota archaeon]|nr:dCTP deaminase, dUMP-forming [Candidatus Woesearchaeota archaeon]